MCPDIVIGCPVCVKIVVGCPVFADVDVEASVVENSVGKVFVSADVSSATLDVSIVVDCVGDVSSVAVVVVCDVVVVEQSVSQNSPVNASGHSHTADVAVVELQNPLFKQCFVWQGPYSSDFSVTTIISLCSPPDPADIHSVSVFSCSLVLIAISVRHLSPTLVVLNT